MGAHINVKVRARVGAQLELDAHLTLPHVRATIAIFLFVRQHTNKLFLQYNKAF